MAFASPVRPASSAFTIVAALLWLVASASQAAGQIQHTPGVDTEVVRKHKAVFVLEFLRRSEWPEGTFEDEETPIVVGLLGRDDFDRILAELCRTQRVRDRRIEFRRFSYPEPPPGESIIDPEEWDRFRRDLRQCHLLFIANTERTRLGRVLNVVQDAPVLTVSDIHQFAERGGMLGLAIREEHMRFDANTRELRKVELRLSSTVLRLARIVETRRDS